MGCSLLFLFLHFYFSNFFISYFNYFILFHFFYLFLYFFNFFSLSFLLPFLLSHVADRVLVLRHGVRPEPLGWNSRVQDTGPPETSRPHVIAIGDSSPRDLYLNAKTQLHPMASKLHCWTPHTKQLQDRNTTPPISREAA